MSCCCSDKKSKDAKSPDCMASKSTTVTTPEGEEVQVNFNMGTGEVTYEPASSCCKNDGASEKTSEGCCCSTKK